MQFFQKTVNKPAGYETFYQALRTLDVPRSLVVNGYYSGTEPAAKPVPQKGDGYVVKKRTNGAPPGFPGPEKKIKTGVKWIKY